MEMDGNGMKWIEMVESTWQVQVVITVKTSATDYLPRFFCHWKIIFTACGLQNDERKNADFKVQLTLTNYYPSLIKENMLHRWHSPIVSPTDFLQINQDPRALAAPQTPTGSNRIQQLSHQGTSGLQPHAPVGTLPPGCSWAGATCGWDVGSSQSHPTHIGCRCTCTAMTWTWKNLDRTSKARRIEHPRIGPLISLYDTINCYILLPLTDVYFLFWNLHWEISMFDSRMGL